MKKTFSCLVWLLFVLTIMYPAGALISKPFNYRFVLVSFPAIAVSLAATAVVLVAFDLIFKITVTSRIIQILLCFLLPLSLFNSIFYILMCPKASVILGILLSVGCCFYLTAKHGQPMMLKFISISLAAIMIIPICQFSFFAAIFGNIGKTTVIESVESPNGRYYAELLDNNHGATGGNTEVVVRERRLVNAIVFRIEKQPKTVYFGRWGEFDDMRIAWKDDDTLIINSEEYQIE